MCGALHTRVCGKGETLDPGFRAGRVCTGESSTCAGEVLCEKVGFLSPGEAHQLVLWAQEGLGECSFGWSRKVSGRTWDWSWVLIDGQDLETQRRGNLPEKGQ